MPKIISVVILALLGIVLPLQAENWKSRKLPRPIIFAQGQWIYSLNPWYNQRPYFSEWTDWPLFIDSNLKEEGVKARLLQYPDYARIQDVIQLYGLDGIGFWEQHSRMHGKQPCAESRACCGDFLPAALQQAGSGGGAAQETAFL